MTTITIEFNALHYILADKSWAYIITNGNAKESKGEGEKGKMLGSLW